jgi:hypothetical protein
MTRGGSIERRRSIKKKTMLFLKKFLSGDSPSPLGCPGIIGTCTWHWTAQTKCQKRIVSYSISSKITGRPIQDKLMSNLKKQSDLSYTDTSRWNVRFFCRFQHEYVLRARRGPDPKLQALLNFIHSVENPDCVWDPVTLQWVPDCVADENSNCDGC